MAAGTVLPDGSACGPFSPPAPTDPPFPTPRQLIPLRRPSASPIPPIKNLLRRASRMAEEIIFLPVMFLVFVGVDVDKLCPHLGIEDGLTAVKSAVAGKQIADGARHRKVQHITGAK